MSQVLQQLRDAQVLSALDVSFARTLAGLTARPSQAVLLGAAFASRAIANGHICADLRRILARPLLDAQGHPMRVQLPSIFEWVMALGDSELCDGARRPAPLVFDGEARLYLTRYWRYQEQLAANLRERATAMVDDIDLGRVGRGLQRLFAPRAGKVPDPRQKLAAAVAALRRFAVITGGPGTGKTTTVVRVLALLVEEALAADRPRPRIVLLAPTGKAAARLMESIAAGRDELPCTDAVKQAIVPEAATIHRRLGYLPGTPTRFAHDAGHPLPADIVLVDEASMIDLALMAKLVDAVPKHARLILLGDKDQLASVEAGAILGDICDVTQVHGYSRAFSAVLDEVIPEIAQTLPAKKAARPGVWDCIVELTRSFRFRDDGGIGVLARAIGEGRAEDALAHLHKEGLQDDAQVKLVALGEPETLATTLKPALLQAFEPYFAAKDPQTRLDLLTGYRLLCAHRRGPYGAERLNESIEQLLHQMGLINLKDGPNYDGRPIMITSNDYQLELFNGDVGLLHRDGDELRAFFPSSTGELRSLSPSRLPAHDPVYAMTVHKSQGSEFDRVGLLLPPALSPILTRELLYTGVTRARKHVTIYGSGQVLAETIRRRIDRASGLRDALWTAS